MSAETAASQSSECTRRAWGSIDGAKQYDRGRPGYAPEAIAFLLGEMRITQASRVVDLGAGTGKLTRQLLSSGAKVVAVEPLEGMRAVLQNLKGSLEIKQGTAEQIPVADASADAVFAAQAWHWFEGDRCEAEMYRILRPGGGVGLIWNQYDVTVPWVSEFAAIRDASTSDSIDTQPAFVFQPPQWAEVRRREFPHSDRIERAMLVDRMLSSSAIAVASEGEKEYITDRINRLVNRVFPESTTAVDVPYITEVFWTKRA